MNSEKPREENMGTPLQKIPTLEVRLAADSSGFCEAIQAAIPMGDAEVVALLRSWMFEKYRELLHADRGGDARAQDLMKMLFVIDARVKYTEKISLFGEYVEWLIDQVLADVADLPEWRPGVAFVG